MSQAIFAFVGALVGVFALEAVDRLRARRATRLARRDGRANEAHDLALADLEADAAAADDAHGIARPGDAGPSEDVTELAASAIGFTTGAVLPTPQGERAAADERPDVAAAGKAAPAANPAAAARLAPGREIGKREADALVPDPWRAYVAGVRLGLTVPLGPVLAGLAAALAEGVLGGPRPELAADGPWLLPLSVLGWGVAWWAMARGGPLKALPPAPSLALHRQARIEATTAFVIGTVRLLGVLLAGILVAAFAGAFLDIALKRPRGQSVTEDGQILLALYAVSTAVIWWRVRPAYAASRQDIDVEWGGGTVKGGS